MKELCHSSALFLNIMSKSNPSALNNAQALLKNHPHPDIEQLVLDPHHHSTPYGSQYPSRDNNDPESGLYAASHRWSDYTLTGSISGRSSSYSWGMDEAELDRAATESVRRKFDKIDAALFDGRSTGTVRVDNECKEWSSKFPHLEIRGIHLLDSMEDGTEMVAPDPFLGLNAPSTEEEEDMESHGCSDSRLMIQGHQIKPLPLLDLDESSPLYEEVIVADGSLEEFFAFDNIDEVHSRLKRHHGIPPVTPNACVRETVMSLAFSHLWNEVISVLQPLIATIRKNTQGHDSSYSMGDDTLTPTEPTLGEGSPQVEPYVQRIFRDPPTLTKATGQSGSKFLRLKYSTPSLQSNLTTTLPQLTNLSGVMQIRSLSLQQRAHSSYVPNILPINDNSREGTPTPTVSDRQELSSQFARVASLSKNPEHQSSATPGPTMLLNNRLISSHMTNRRNINTTMLKPLERPKTPALVPIDNGIIRGFKLGGNTSHNSPPSTPYIRHMTHLPPIEGGGGGVVTTGGQPVSYSERSPTTQVRISAQQKNRVTFSSRIVNAADGYEQWNLPRGSGGGGGGGGDMRPSTSTSTSLRHNPDGGQKSIGRKISDNNLHLGRMKVVGYATGFHGVNSAGGGGGSGGGDLRDKMSTVIIEDEEELDEEPSASFTVTGIFQSKPRSVSSRTKSRGHIR